MDTFSMVNVTFVLHQFIYVYTINKKKGHSSETSETATVKLLTGRTKVVVIGRQGCNMTRAFRECRFLCLRNAYCRKEMPNTIKILI